LRQIELPFYRRRHIAKSRDAAAQCREVIRQIDEDFQARRDAEPPAAIGAAQRLRSILSLQVDTVLIL